MTNSNAKKACSEAMFFSKGLKYMNIPEPESINTTMIKMFPNKRLSII